MRTPLRPSVVALLLGLAGCGDSAMIDSHIKPEITGEDVINSFPPERRSQSVGTGHAEPKAAEGEKPESGH